MTDHEVPFKNAKKDCNGYGTSELKRRGLIDELLQHGPNYLKARSISIVNSARNKHHKIPYAEIGEALRYTAADLTDEQLGKLFING